MTKAISFGAVMLPFALYLAACSDGPSAGDAVTPKHPGYGYVVFDVSTSARVHGADAYGQRARARAAQVVSELQLGDRLQLVEVGSLQSDRLVAHPMIKTGYRLSLAKARKQLAQQLEEVASRTRASGGDGTTNIIATLSNLQPDCASGRTDIKLLSDGVESSEAFDAGVALATGKPVTLPPPATPYLRGCRVEFIGFGMVSDGSEPGGQLLPVEELEALRKSWLVYMKAAGTSDVTFTSLI